MSDINIIKLEEDIFDFILFSQALCKKAKDIFSLIKKSQPSDTRAVLKYLNDPNIHLLKLTGNLFVNQCIVELGSLLDDDRRQKTLFELLKVKGVNMEAKTELEVIAKDFKDKRLLVIRHQFIAHRSTKSSGGPTSMIFSIYKDEIIINCEKIIDDIVEFWTKYIGPRPGNNMFLDKLEKMDKTVNLLLNNTKQELHDD